MSYSENISSISSHCGNLQFFLFTSNCKPTPSSTRSNMSNEPVKRPFSISEIVVLLTLVFSARLFCVFTLRIFSIELNYKGRGNFKKYNKINKKKAPIFRSGLFESGAGNETRTRDPNLGKVVLYQLSYSRRVDRFFTLKNEQKRIWSGKRDSNSRPQPWQGCALPTELFPHAVYNTACKNRVNNFMKNLVSIA